MNRTTRLAFAVGAVAVLVTAVLPAQNLLDNEFYRKARMLSFDSQQALQQGDYDRAASLAAEAKQNLALSDEYVERAMRFYRANGWLNRANDRIAYAKSIRADVNFREGYERAVGDARAAKQAMEARDYDKSVDLSRSALAALENISAVEAPRARAAPPTLPRYYVVRLIPERRDCFWFIAEYPFIYNDPWQWRLIYEANKSLLPDPNNPDLIEPGLVFVIPSLRGEKREGTYDPKTTYPSLAAGK